MSKEITKKCRYGCEHNIILDDEDVAMFIINVWHICYGENTCYVKLAGKTGTKLHHMVLGIESCSDYHVHHINKNGLDNRKENLAILSPSEHRSIHMKENTIVSEYGGNLDKKPVFI